MFHKEGQKIIFIALVITVVGVFIVDYTIQLPWLRTSLMLLLVAFLILILQFFRKILTRF